VATLGEARAIFDSIAHFQLMVVDLSLGLRTVEELHSVVRGARNESVRWVATLGLLRPDSPTQRSRWLDLGFDAVVVGPFSDTLLEKRFRQAVLDAGADPKDESQLEALFGLLGQGEYVRAENVIRRGLRRFPDSLAYVTLQCELHLRFKRHREALLLAMASLHGRPGYTPLRHIAARCYVLEGNVSQAFIILEQTEREPEGERFALHFDTFEEVVRCLNNEGVRRAFSGDTEDALGLYTHALDSTASFPDKHRYLLWHNMGMAYKRVGTLEKAHVALSKAVDLAPRGFAQAHLALAEVEQSMRARTRDRSAALAAAAVTRTPLAPPQLPQVSLTKPLRAKPAIVEARGTFETPPDIASPSLTQTDDTTSDSMTFGALRSLGASLTPPVKEPRSTSAALSPAPNKAPEDALDGAPEDALDGAPEDALDGTPEAAPMSLEALLADEAFNEDSGFGVPADGDAAEPPLDSVLTSSMAAEAAVLATLTERTPSPSPREKVGSNEKGGTDASRHQDKETVDDARAQGAGAPRPANKSAASARKAARDGASSAPSVDDQAAQREKRRRDRLKFIMFEKALEDA
jgi:tetratricopeptide (TPR) repeat protein